MDVNNLYIHLSTYLPTYLSIHIPVQVPSATMLGVRKQSPPVEPVSSAARPSNFKDACSRMDLTAIHEILVKTHYKEDSGENEVSCQYNWMPPSVELNNSS